MIIHPTNVRRLAGSACILAAAFLLLTETAFSQSVNLAEARDVYRTGDFDRAITMFEAVINETEISKSDKKDALQYLGRAYIAKSEYEDARRVVESLIALEPPLVELDPDMEPPPLMNIYYEVRKDYEGYEVQRPDPGMQTLAIMDFTNASVEDFDRLEPLEQGFASMMINYLSGATDLKVVERERIQWLLQELNMQRDDDVVDESTAVRMGKLMGAHVVLFGSYTMHKKEMWISSRLVKVETGEVLLAEQIFGRADEFFQAIEDLSLKVAKAINVTLADAQLGPRTETRSLDAMLSYSEGLKLLERNDFRAAYEKFNEALTYDPDYTRAKLKAESLSPMLAAR